MHRYLSGSSYAFVVYFSLSLSFIDKMFWENAPACIMLSVVPSGKGRLLRNTDKPRAN